MSRLKLNVQHVDQAISELKMFNFLNIKTKLNDRWISDVCLRAGNVYVFTTRPYCACNRSSFCPVFAFAPCIDPIKLIDIFMNINFK